MSKQANPKIKKLEISITEWNYHVDKLFRHYYGRKYQHDSLRALTYKQETYWFICEQMMPRLAAIKALEGCIEAGQTTIKDFQDVLFVAHGQISPIHDITIQFEIPNEG